MTIALSTPAVDELGEVVDALRDWQSDELPLQLHPGDLGWFWQFGAEAMAAALRIWRRDGQIVALGQIDGPGVLRWTADPATWRDDAVAGQVVADVTDPQRGILAAGKAAIETPDGTLVRERLDEAGWNAGEPWSPLRRDLAAPVEESPLRIEVIEPGRQEPFLAVHHSAWGSERFTDERWRAMVGGVPFIEGRCLLGYADDVPVAGVTVWSAGPGRPGLLEPMGVHADHRGQGHGRSICLAAAAVLRDLGASSAEVCTLSSLTGAVATYRAAGYEPLPERLDRSRDD